MNFQTRIPIFQQSSCPIDYDSKIFLLGSCFSENIGNKLSYCKFQSAQNPFGILFHPKAIETLIYRAINEKQFTENEVFFFNERWHCFDVHSHLSSISKESILDTINAELTATLKHLKKSSHLVITLGTSWVYRLKESNAIVANCHKIPQHQFVKELLTVNQISTSLKSMVSLIKKINPSINFIFTISPVRHLKDGFIENQLSKSNLISAVHDVKGKEEKIFYFPSYEIMMDELRDYRFYKEDMIHPNSIAIDYIWEKFSEGWISNEAMVVAQQIMKIQKSLEHKPFNPASKEHLKFLESVQKQIKKVQEKYPRISF